MKRKTEKKETKQQLSLTLDFFSFSLSFQKKKNKRSRAGTHRLRRPVLLRPDQGLPLGLLPAHGLQGGPPARQPPDVHRPLDGARALQLGRRGLRALGDAQHSARVGAGASDGGGRDVGAVQRQVALGEVFWFWDKREEENLGQREQKKKEKKKKKNSLSLPGK